MRILAISDEESRYLWDFFEKSKLEGIDLIISCGDLDPRYLSFLATFTTAPVLYVHGNHDDRYNKIPPDGCISIEDKIYVHEGVRILGLGGSMRYSEGEHQSEQVRHRELIRDLLYLLAIHQSLNHHTCPMHGAPYNKGICSSMPEAAHREDNHRVEHPSGFAASVATEREIDIVAKPCGE